MLAAFKPGFRSELGYSPEVHLQIFYDEIDVKM